MGLRVTFISGVRRSGKSALIQLMIDRLARRAPHYIRLVAEGSDKRMPRAGRSPGDAEGPKEKCGVASARWLGYDATRIFELLPDALAEIHRADRYGTVFIEADADPVLRCAYDYDHRVFVMPQPSRIHDVFRDPARAAQELERVLDDTQAFASEIFGLFADPAADFHEPREARPTPTSAQMRGFLYSPLGDELATRIQLQPPYHGLVESDVIVINNCVGEPTAETTECLKRIERLLDRTRGHGDRRGELIFGDPFDERGRTTKQLLKVLKPMMQGGK